VKYGWIENDGWIWVVAKVAAAVVWMYFFVQSRFVVKLIPAPW